MIIALSGTPGTGKTTVADKIGKEIGYKVVELSKLIKKDSDLETEINIAKLNRIAKKVINHDTIIESHLAHFLKSSEIDLFIVLRCNPLELIKRLKKRNYDKRKIYDNVMFEALEGTSIEARELHKNVIEIDNTKNTSNTVKEIISLIKTGKKPIYRKEDYTKYIVKIEKILEKR